MKQFGINFAAYGPLIEDQLKDQGLKFIVEDGSKRVQRWADAVTNLRISDIITDGEADKANKRIMKQLTKLVVERGEK